MDEKEIVALLERRFTTLEQRIDESRAEARQRFEQIDRRFEQIDSRFEKLEGEVRHANVQIESLRGEIHLVAEGVENVDQKLERFRSETDRRFVSVEGLIRSSCGHLEQRIAILEGNRR